MPDRRLAWTNTGCVCCHSRRGGNARWLTIVTTNYKPSGAKQSRTIRDKIFFFPMLQLQMLPLRLGDARTFLEGNFGRVEVRHGGDQDKTGAELRILADRTARLLSCQPWMSKLGLRRTGFTCGFGGSTR